MWKSAMITNSINYAVPKITTCVLYYLYIMYKYCYYTALYNVHFSQDNI